jgi:hypothetical protein
MILTFTETPLSPEDAYAALRALGYGSRFAGQAVAEAEAEGQFYGPDLEVTSSDAGIMFTVRSI